MPGTPREAPVQKQQAGIGVFYWGQWLRQGAGFYDNGCGTPDDSRNGQHDIADEHLPGRQVQGLVKCNHNPDKCQTETGYLNPVKFFSGDENKGAQGHCKGGCV